MNKDPGSRRNRRLGSSSSSHVKAATRTARARWFPSDAGGSPSQAAVRQALLTSSEHRRAAGPLVRFNPNGGAGRTLRSGKISYHRPRRGRTAASADVAAPMLDVAGSPSPPRGSRDPLPSRVKVYRAVGMGGPSAGTDCTAEQLRSLGGSARGRSNGTVHGPETVGGSFPFTMVLPSSAPGPYAPRGGLLGHPLSRRSLQARQNRPQPRTVGGLLCCPSAGMAVPDK